ECLSAGEPAREARDEILGALAAGVGPDDPAGLAPTLLGGVARLLAIRLRDGGVGLLEGDADDLRRWLAAYELPAGRELGRPPAPPTTRPPALDPPAHRRAGHGGPDDGRRRVGDAIATCAYARSYWAAPVADV